jgi:hypothetical protein
MEKDNKQPLRQLQESVEIPTTEPTIERKGRDGSLADPSDPIPPFGLGGFVSDAELVGPAVTSTDSQQGGDAGTGGQVQTTSTTSTTTEKL